MTHEDARPGEEFAQAFAQAVTAVRTPENAGPAPEIPGELPAEPAPDAENASGAPGHDQNPAGETAATTDESQDFQTLYERERQRLRSFEGRVRRERDAWRRQEADFRRRLETAAANEADPDAPTPDMSSLPSLPSLIEQARREAMDAVAPYLEELKAERHQAAVAAAHPDWREVAEDPELEEFIDRQPGFVAEAMRRVVRDGEADEVVALLDEFKRARAPRRSEDSKEKGRPASGTKPAAPAPSHDDVLEPALAVPSRASQPPIGRQKAVDYASAWAEATREVSRARR